MDVQTTGILVCGTCQTDQTYVGTAALNRHYRLSHGPLAMYLCGQLGCHKAFRDLTSMIRHITNVHKIIFQALNIDDDRQSDTFHNQDSDLGSTSEADDLDSFDDTITVPLQEEEEEEEEDDIQEGTLQENLNRSAVKLLISLRSKASLTGAAVERFEKGCFSLIKKLCDNIATTVASRLQEKGLTLEDAHEVLREVESISDPFQNLKTIDDQLNYFEKHFGLVKPVEKFLDTRIDRRLDPSTNSHVPAQVKETFQYVPLIKSLTAILKNKKYRDLILKHQAASAEGTLRSYADGSHCKEHPFIHKHDNVIQLLMFFDELEIATALGSKTIIHKLATFFCQILCLPPELSSQLESIFLVALAHADDLKKHGAMEKVLTPLVQELKKLSSDNGVEVEVEGEMYVLRAVLVAVTADTLAAHDLIGLSGPGANLFCRQCMVSRQEVRLNANAMGEPRTPEEHQRHVEMVAERPNLSKQCGVKRSCPLNQVPFFDCTSSFVFDAFHDLLEGVVPLDLKLVIRHFIFRQKLFSVRDLNLRIASYAYGVPDAKNKPSPNFTDDMLCKGSGKLKQTGSQMWCLARSLPFLIGDKVPGGSPYMELIFLLQNVMQIIFSFEVVVDDLQYMDDMITQHNQLFQQLFVDVPDDELLVEVAEDDPGNNDLEQAVDDPVANPNEEEIVDEGAAADRRNRKKLSKVYVINKLHHLKHYFAMALAYGPPVRMWCAKFEGRMKIFRQHASICCNFKNPTMTMAKMFQLSGLSTLLGQADRFLDFHRGTEVRVGDAQHRDLLNAAGLNNAVQVTYTNCATLNGEEYRQGLFACLPGAPASTPSFGIITDIIVAQKGILLVLRPWRNAGLSPVYNCFNVQPDHESDLVLLGTNSLRHFRCIAPWTPQTSDDIYLSMRTVLV